VIAAGLVWLLLLRGRLRRQKAIIQQKLQREAVLEERERLAREFHDSLQQDLIGITLQLDTVALQLVDTPGRAGSSLDVARQMTRRSVDEAHRAVWDLRSQALEGQSLPEALTRVIQPLTENEGVELSVAVSGNPRRLPGWAEHHLLRIGQETATNAIKHGQARNLRALFDYRKTSLFLRLEDDGHGFATDAFDAGRNGHFGLLGAKERAEKLGGQLEFRSAPGQGAVIQIEVPYDLPEK
jgi:signal transduction histidine kinase